MSTMMHGNIALLFALDSLVSNNPDNLSEYMRSKHGWTKDQFAEYKGQYLAALADKDYQNALQSLNPDTKNDTKEFVLNTSEKGRIEFSITHGDVWVSDRNGAEYVYLYNPHLYRYMFRRCAPANIIWWEVFEVAMHAEFKRNIFEATPEKP